MSINVSDAKKTPQIIIRDNAGNILSVITPKDLQVGFQGSPGDLILKGGLDINAEIVTLVSPVYNLSKDQLALFIRNSAAQAIEINLPSAPIENGKTYIVKDFAGNSSTYDITVKTTDSKLIDGSSTKVISTDYDACMFVWTGNEWATLSLSAGGGGAGGAPTNASYVTISSNGTLTAERTLTGTSGQIAITDNGANSTVVLSLISVISAGTFAYPSSVTVDAYGRITAITAGSPSAGGGDTGAAYVTLALTSSLSNERKLTVSGSTGLLLTDSGANNDVTLSINNSLVATVTGTNFSGPVLATGGLSGSLQQLVNGTSFIMAGANVTVTSASNGQITIASTGGSGGGGDPNASYVVMGTTSSLSNERVLTAGAGISIVDNVLGTGSPVTISVSGTFSSSLNIFNIFHGNISSPQSSGTKESIGMTYIDQTRLAGTKNYYFRAILAASTGSTVSYLDLYDYNGIINGTPQPISGSVITGSSTSSTYFSIELPILTSVTGSGLIEARLWCTPTGTYNQAICKNAKLEVYLS